MTSRPADAIRMWAIEQVVGPGQITDADQVVAMAAVLVAFVLDAPGVVNDGANLNGILQ